MFKKKKHGVRHKQKLPLLATGGAAVYAYNIYSQQKTHAPGPDKTINIVYNATGFNIATGKMDWTKAFQVFAPPVIGAAGSMLMSRMGMNRYLSKVPFVKW